MGSQTPGTRSTGCATAAATTPSWMAMRLCHSSASLSRTVTCSCLPGPLGGSTCIVSCRAPAAPSAFPSCTACGKWRGLYPPLLVYSTVAPSYRHQGLSLNEGYLEYHVEVATSST